ncbi:MAG: hypothetical protein U0R19_33740 [Bryobacteraceae bacterium]
MIDRRLAEDVLFAFSVEPKHDRQTLENYLRRYPELAEELIDLSHEIRLVAELGESEIEVVVDTPVTGVVETVQRRPEDLFNDIKGATFRALATSLNVPSSILMALRDRLVVPSSIPVRFLNRLSNALGASVDAVQAYMEQPPTVAAALSFKADRKPSVPDQITFSELVRNTSLTESQEAELRQDLSGDERN